MLRTGSGVSKTGSDEETQRMLEIIGRLFRSHSDNRKSAIQNRKLVGFVAIGVAFALCGVEAHAQQTTKVPRIGFLFVNFPSSTPARYEGFRQGLRELGYVEGKNIVIESRYAEGKVDRLPALLAELVRLKVDVIVSTGPSATRAAKEANVTIPIVMSVDIYPV
jgi:ABC-type uncharacterized transport system substrate-binding protein